MLRKISVTLGVLAASVMASQGAQAAITVLGNGLAQNCFQAAEFGGNPTDGVSACTEALEMATLSVRDRAATLVNRGILYSRMDEPKRALADYNQGLGTDATLGEGYVDRGAVLIVLRRYREALRDIDKGIALGANRPQIAYYDRALAHEALGDVRAAYEDYKKATEIEPDFTLARVQLERFKVIHHGSEVTY